MSLRSKVCDLIHSQPGITQLEIATTIYGPGTDQGQVNRMCRQLVDQGYVVRSGKGGPYDPFRYNWSQVRQHGPAARLRDQQQQSSRTETLRTVG